MANVLHVHSLLSMSESSLVNLPWLWILYSVYCIRSNRWIVVYIHIAILFFARISFQFCISSEQKTITIWLHESKVMISKALGELARVVRLNKVLIRRLISITPSTVRVIVPFITSNESVNERLMQEKQKEE